MSDLLSRVEMASLNRALAKRTGGRVKVGSKPITVGQGIAVWNCTASFDRSNAPNEVRTATDLSRVLGTGTVLAVAASLAGCATLGGNVKGSFSCRAPDGICAPTSTIDDAALAMIGGEASTQPAGPYNAPWSSPRMIETATIAPVRSNEKVLRIVFPAHIDGAGRFREATAIHAVVERGEWMAAGQVQAIPAQAQPTTGQLGTDASQQLALASAPPMRSLVELAAAAPEVKFPDPVAEIDATNAAAPVAMTPTTKIAKPATALVAKPVTLQSETAALSGRAGRRVAPVRVMSPIPAPVTPGAAAPIAYSLPPKSTANPIDAIRNQVAAQLRAARPVGAAPTASGGATQGQGTTTSKPVNSPALFPASEVNP